MGLGKSFLVRLWQPGRVCERRGHRRPSAHRRQLHKPGADLALRTFNSVQVATKIRRAIDQKEIKSLINQVMVYLAQHVLQSKRNRFAVISPNSLSILPKWLAPPSHPPVWYGGLFFAGNSCAACRRAARCRCVLAAATIDRATLAKCHGA
jgi:hypothetical protein